MTPLFSHIRSFAPCPNRQYLTRNPPLLYLTHQKLISLCTSFLSPSTIKKISYFILRTKFTSSVFLLPEFFRSWWPSYQPPFAFYNPAHTFLQSPSALSGLQPSKHYGWDDSIIRSWFRPWRRHRGWSFHRPYTPPPNCGPLAYGTQIVHYGYSLNLYLQEK